MKHLCHTTAIALAMGSCAFAAHAQDTANPETAAGTNSCQTRWTKADTNKDAMISKGELSKAVDVQFDAIDKDNNGQISRTEYLDCQHRGVFEMDAEQAGRDQESFQQANANAAAQEDDGAAKAAEEQLSDVAKQQEVEVLDLAVWGADYYPQLYQGVSVDRLIGTEAVGPTGDVVGDVEDVVFGPKGQAQRLIVASYGFLDAGDSHFGVPWRDVDIPEGAYDVVRVPITQENLEEYPLFPEDTEAGARQRSWVATELLNDYVSLQDVRDYGYLTDLIINRDGNLDAVIVNPAYGYGVGYYAYPYYGYGYGWWAGYPYYDLPYAAADVEDLPRFSYERMPGGAPEDQQTGSIQQRDQTGVGDQQPESGGKAQQ